MKLLKNELYKIKNIFKCCNKENKSYKNENPE